MGALVSVVITTKNEAKNIEACLKSLQAQTYQPLEIIVVDNGSTDETQALARRYTSQVYEKGPERSAQRNFGLLEKSQGEYGLFLDADMILSPNLIAEAVKEMEKGTCVALHLPEIVLGKTYWSQVRRFERGFYDGTVIDGARFFRRRDFERIGGFDESFSGPEDWDLDKKFKQLGPIGLLRAPGTACPPELEQKLQDCGVDPNRYGAVVFHNEAEFDLKRYLSKKGYYIESFDRYIAKWGGQDPEVRLQFSPFYRFFGVFLERGKGWRLLGHPILTAGMYGLRFLVGLRFLLRNRQ